jgi:glycosyltransferase involved in cell wall biosynthesis
MKQKILIFSSSSMSLLNFRGHLIKTLVFNDYEVTAAAPRDNTYDQVEKWCKESGVELHPLVIKNTGKNPFQDLFTLINMILLIIKIRPNILFAYGIKPVIYSSIGGYITKVPSIFSMITGLGNCFINENEASFFSKILNFFYKFALSCNKKVIFQNEDDASLFENKGMVNKNQIVIVNGSGVDLSHFQYRELTSSTTRFLFIGRLIKQKGIVEYIKACKVLKKKYPHITFSVVGERYSNPSMLNQEEFENLKSLSDIEYLGKMEDVRHILNKSSVFVLPSYREGTSRATLEAMATGLPIVTTNAPGCWQTVQEGVNGFIVPTKDTLALIEAMEKFILNPEIISGMGKESRKIVEQKYDVHAVNKQILDIL